MNVIENNVCKIKEQLEILDFDKKYPVYSEYINQKLDEIISEIEKLKEKQKYCLGYMSKEPIRSPQFD